MLLKVAIERLHLHTGGTSVPLLYHLNFKRMARECVH